MNKTFVTGNLGKDAEVIETMVNGQDGQPKKYLQFAIAHTEKFQGREETTWYWCFVYNQRIVNSGLVQYLTKGTKVLIEGKLRADIYTPRQTNQPTVSYTINATSVELLSSAQRAPQEPSQNSSEQPAADASSSEDDDLPF